MKHIGKMHLWFDLQVRGLPILFLGPAMKLSMSLSCAAEAEDPKALARAYVAPTTAAA